MKKSLTVVPRFFRGKRASAALGILIFGTILKIPASAATANWTGSGTVQSPTGGVFSSLDNWENDLLPVFDATTDLSFQLSSDTYVATNDLGTIELNSLLLGAGAIAEGNGLPGSRLVGGTFRFLADGATKPMLSITGGGQHIHISSNFSLGADLDLVRHSNALGKITLIGMDGLDGGNINLGSHTFRITRPSSFASEANRIFIGTSGSISQGVVQGTGKIVIEDPSYVPMSNDNGPLTLHLSSRSTYSGGTEVKQGALAIAGETFLSNGVVESGPFGTGPVRMHAGVLRSGQGKRTLFNTVEVNGSFQLGYSNFNGIAVAGNIQLNGSHTITVAANTSGSVEVSGPISESTAGVGLTWNLQGDLELTSIANYTGPTVVKGAGLHLNAPGSLGASPLVLTSGAKLFGDGTTASILAETNTTISPGEGIGTLRTFGDARLESNSHLRFEIDSNQGGIGYDQWNLQGTVALIDADLQLLGAFQIHPADTFFLVLNDGNEPVSGTFTRLNGTVTNLAQGAVFVAASELFEISYTAEEGVGFTGSGNDIAIRAVPEPSTLTLLLLSLSTLTRHRKR